MRKDPFILVRLEALSLETPAEQGEALAGLVQAELARGRLKDAVGELKRANAVVTSSYNRVRAAKTRVASLQADETNRVSTPDQLLEAHSRFADAESRYSLALVEFVVAVRNVHVEKGSLLESKGIHLQDAFSNGPLPTMHAVPPLKSIIPDMMPNQQPAPAPNGIVPPSPGIQKTTSGKLTFPKFESISIPAN